MCRRSGLEFVERISAVWAASGTLTMRRRQALDAHLRQVRTGTSQRLCPGSYSWPNLRNEAERRFAAGEQPAAVIAELRATYADGPAMVPSVRTMRRWFTQGRWLSSPSVSGRARRDQPPRHRTRRAHPMIELLLTGYGYPPRATGHHHTLRGP